MTPMTKLHAGWRRVVALALALAAASVAVGATLAPTDDPQASPVWLKVRATLFGDRPIAPAPADLLTLEAPARAIDAAVVPIAIRTRLPEGSQRFVSKLYLIIDANPSPISAIFDFTPDSGRAEVETRVRVDAYSFVRAIAETSDGQLYGVVRFVKASGGCSAPAGSDAQAARARLGQMHFRVDGDLAGDRPVRAQLLIEHPNDSGMAMDQLTRQFAPPHFVRKVEVSYDGRPVFAADVDFSISENPNFRFYLLPRGGKGELQATVVDSQDKRFVAAESLAEAAR
jgi:sulfur-oxidizing protein SoxY